MSSPHQSDFQIKRRTTTSCVHITLDTQGEISYSPKPKKEVLITLRGFVGFEGSICHTPLKLDDRLTFPALDSDQVPQDLRYGPPARTGYLGDDPLLNRLHPNLPHIPPTTFTKMVICQIGQWRPRDMGKLLPIFRTAAFIHHQ
jgi:hypothetical protein